MLEAADTLTIRENEGLTRLRGLEGLDSIGDFSLEQNPLLMSLVALAGVEKISRSAVMEDNPRLSTCEAHEFVTRSGAPASTVLGNGTCN